MSPAPVPRPCASVRADGKANGKPTGVLAIHFNWEPQARAIVKGVRAARPRRRASPSVSLLSA